MTDSETAEIPTQIGLTGDALELAVYRMGIAHPGLVYIENGPERQPLVLGPARKRNGRYGYGNEVEVRGWWAEARTALLSRHSRITIPAMHAEIASATGMTVSQRTVERWRDRYGLSLDEPSAIRARPTQKRSAGTSRGRARS